MSIKRMAGIVCLSCGQPGGTSTPPALLVGCSCDRDKEDEVEQLEVTLRLARETKNTLRYEEVESDQPPVIGTLYLQKFAAKRLGDPEVIKVSVTAGEAGK